MWAYRLTDWGTTPEICDIEVPVPAPGEVLVRVAGVGLCHSDLTMAQMPGSIAEGLGWHVPFTLGHETTGWVESLGGGVESLRIGEPVAVLSPNPCGVCEDCRVDRQLHCRQASAGRGYGRDGGLGEFVVAPAWHLVPLGELDPWVVAPLTDAAATSHHAVARVAPRLAPGAKAAVIGAGGLGVFAVQMLAAVGGIEVAAIDPEADRRDIARRHGAEHVFDGVDRSTASALRDWSGGGVEVVLDFVGTDDTIRAGLRALRPGGAFGLVGAGGGTFTRPWFGGLPADGEIFTFQGSTLSDLRAVVELAQRGHLLIEVEHFARQQVSEAYDALEAGRLRGRAVVHPVGST